MKVPKSWDEITLNQYSEITDIIAVDMDELDRQVKILSILTGETEDYILDLDLTEVKKHIRDIRFIYSVPSKAKVIQKIKIKGNRYFVNLNVRDITGGEYIDLMSLTKDKAQINSNLADIIAIFLKPINIFGYHKRSCYRKNDNGILVQTLESRTATAKLIKEHLKMSTVFSMSGFFLKNWEALTKATLDSIIKTNEMKKKWILKQMKKDGFKYTGHGT